MAKWLRQRFAKPLFPSSNLGGASIKKSTTNSAGIKHKQARMREYLSGAVVYASTSHLFLQSRQ